MDNKTLLEIISKSPWINVSTASKILKCGFYPTKKLFLEINEERKANGFYVPKETEVPIKDFIEKIGIDIEFIKKNL